MKRYQILFFGDQWDDMWRRRQQLAWRLSKSNLSKHVVYIERPLPFTSLVKYIVGRADREGKKRWRRVLGSRRKLMALSNKFSVLTTFAPLPPVGPKWVFQASESYRSRWLVRRLLKDFAFDRPFIWISNPQMSVDEIRDLNPGLLWYDCTEDMTVQHGLSNCAITQMRDTDRWIKNNADVVTAVSQKLVSEISHIRPDTHWLPNAVDTELFLKSLVNYPVPKELLGISRPILSFVGLGGWCHDWDLLYKVASLKPEWNFLLIGPFDSSFYHRDLLNRNSNIIFIGMKSYKTIPAYLVNSDVCFQFYKSIRMNDTRNSQKLFLYLASGKPVVSTPSADVQSYKELVYIAKTAEEFVVAVELALRDDCNALRRRRQTFALTNSWDARIKKIGKILRSFNSV